jgi:hypothetical protein
MNTVNKHKFYNRPIQLFVYIPEQVISHNDKLFYSNMYKHLCDNQYFVCDNVESIELALTEKRTNLFVLLREKADLARYLPMTRLAYVSEKVYAKLPDLPKFCATIRYETEALICRCEDCYIKLDKNDNGLLIVDAAINKIFQCIKHELKSYNIYINGAEVVRDDK